MKQLYKTIEHMSHTLISDGDSWRKQISSAKNYICTPDMQHWTFGKSAYEYRGGGGEAKEWIYSLGFINVLTIDNQNYKDEIIDNFLKWAELVTVFDIKSKFIRQQNAKHPFELLVHKETIAVINSKSMQDEFEEGFKNYIIKESTYRDKKAVETAKQVYGTYCYACGFDFGNFYGNHGKGFIEVHHLYPMKL